MIALSATRRQMLAGLLCGSVLALPRGARAAAEAGERPVYTPLPGRSGLDLGRIDRAVSPGADFFRFANGRWYDSVIFNPEDTYVGARANLIALRKARIRAIIEDAGAGRLSGALAGRIGALYASYLNQPAIEAAGLTPIGPELDRIRALASVQDLLDMFAQAPAKGLPSPLTASIFYDFHAPGRLRYQLAPGGLGLPQRELYTDTTAPAADLRAAYALTAAKMLDIAGESGARDKADQVLALETRLAEAAWPTADARDFLKTANPLSVNALTALAPEFDWRRFLAFAGVEGADTVIVTQPTAMPKIARIISETPIDVWRHWAVVHLLSINAPYLSQMVEDVRFDFFEKRLSGRQKPTARWQRGVELVETYFGDALGQLYVQRHFPERNKRMVAAMFDNIRAVMREKVERAAWMEPPTRAEALRKIDELNVKIGYPDVWPEVEDLKLSASDLFGNVRIARARAWRSRAALVHAPLPRGKWMTPAQTSGAAANPNLNEITIPAGALEPPYFSPQADASVNYGGIGAVIAHEFSHLFDQLGRQMDAIGKLRDWWSAADGARFKLEADKVARQFDGVPVRGEMRVNGRLTLNENIADVAGLDIAFAAWQRSLHGRRAPVIDGFSGPQRFFLAWAQMRAGKMTDPMLRQQLAGGPHSPDEVRGTQPLRNIDHWYAAFSVKPSDPLFLPYRDRARFW